VRAVLTLVAPAERFGARDRKKQGEAVKSYAAQITDYLNGRAVND
jgi:DNA-binding IclR family transcriptional regulator